MSAETTLQKVMSILGITKEASVQVELAQAKTADGQATFESDNFAIGEAVFIVTPDGNIPAPQGEYTLEDGMEIVVDANGVIQEVAMPSAEAVEEETIEAEDQPMKEEIEEADMGMYPKKKMETAPKKVVKSKTEMEESYFASQLEKKVAELEVKLSALQSENSELLDRLNKEESPRTKFSPEAKMSNEKIFKLGAKREESIQDRIFNQLF